MAARDLGGILGFHSFGVVHCERLLCIDGSFRHHEWQSATSKPFTDTVLQLGGIVARNGNAAARLTASILILEPVSLPAEIGAERARRLNAYFDAAAGRNEKLRVSSFRETWLRTVERVAATHLSSAMTVAAEIGIESPDAFEGDLLRSFASSDGNGAYISVMTQSCGYKRLE